MKLDDLQLNEIHTMIDVLHYQRVWLNDNNVIEDDQLPDWHYSSNDNIVPIKIIPNGLGIWEIQFRMYSSMYEGEFCGWIGKLYVYDPKIRSIPPFLLYYKDHNGKKVCTMYEIDKLSTLIFPLSDETIEMKRKQAEIWTANYILNQDLKNQISENVKHDQRVYIDKLSYMKNVREL